MQWMALLQHRKIELQSMINNKQALSIDKNPMDESAGA
jgi:hypothetical protein